MHKQQLNCQRFESTQFTHTHISTSGYTCVPAYSTHIFIPIIRSISSSPSFISQIWHVYRILCMNGCYGPFYSFHYFPFSPYVCGEYVCCIFIAECVHSFITSSQYAITLPFFALIISVCVCVFHFVTSLVSHSFLFFFIACLFLADELHMCSTRARTNKHLHCCAGHKCSEK